MITNDLTVEQQEREECYTHKRAAIKTLISVVIIHNRFFSTSSPITMTGDNSGMDLEIMGHTATDFIAVARLMGLSGFASGHDKVTIY